MTSASPTRMRSAAMAIALRPDEQKRLMVTPPTVLGKPPKRRPIRAILRPCCASGIAQPMMASSIVAGSSVGTCLSACCNALPNRSSGLVFFKDPRPALPTALRVAATIYASCIGFICRSFY